MISKYLPEVLKTIKEFQELASTEDVEIATLWQTLQDAFDDQFVNDATEDGVERWESLLSIVPKGTDNLDVRKFRILSRLSEQVPYTYTSLETSLIALCGENGYMLELLNGTYTLEVKVELTAKQKFDEVQELLDRVVPANLTIDLSLLYNQHQDFTVYTHAQLVAYTHDQLRNEVIS